MLGKYYNPNR